MTLTTLTGFPIFRHGTAGPPHVVGVLTLIVLALAVVAGRFRAFGRASAYVETIGYPTSVLLLMIPAVTETLTRVPPSAPLVASPEEPIFPVLYAGLLVLFLAGVTSQVRRATSPRG